MYCRKTDRNQYKGSFHVEHYKPKNRFPELVNEYNNLFYACATCNQFKGDYWSDEKPLQVLNPCDHVMSHHLMFSHELVEKLTPQGEFNIELLRLNNNESILFRREAIGSILSLIKIVFSLKNSNYEDAREGINLAVMMLVELTQHDEDKIRRVLKV